MNCKMPHPSFKKPAHPTPPPHPPIRSHLWLFWSDFRERGAAHCPLELLQASVSPAVERRGGMEERGWGHRCCAELEFAQRCNVISEPTAPPPCQPLSQAAGLISPALAPACWHCQPLSPTPAAGRISASWPELLTFAAGLADPSQMATL